MAAGSRWLGGPRLLLLVAWFMTTLHEAHPLNLLDQFLPHNDNDIQGFDLFSSSGQQGASKCAQLCFVDSQCLAFTVSKQGCFFKNTTIAGAGDAYTVSRGTRTYERARTNPPTHTSCGVGAFGTNMALPSWTPIRFYNGAQNCRWVFSEQGLTTSCVPGYFGLESDWFEAPASSCSVAVNIQTGEGAEACCQRMSGTSLVLRWHTQEGINQNALGMTCHRQTPGTCRLTASLSVDHPFSMLLMTGLYEADSDVAMTAIDMPNCGQRAFTVTCPSPITVKLSSSQTTRSVTWVPPEGQYTTRTEGTCQATVPCTSKTRPGTAFHEGRHKVVYTCSAPDGLNKMCSFAVTVVASGETPAPTPAASTAATTTPKGCGHCGAEAVCVHGRCECTDDRMTMFQGHCVLRPEQPVNFNVKRQGDAVLLSWDRPSEYASAVWFRLAMRSCDSSIKREIDLGFPVVPFHPNVVAQSEFEYKVEDIPASCWTFSVLGFTEEDLPGYPTRTVRVDFSRHPPPPPPTRSPLPQSTATSPHPTTTPWRPPTRSRDPITNWPTPEPTHNPSVNGGGTGYRVEVVVASIILAVVLIAAGGGIGVYQLVQYRRRRRLAIFDFDAELNSVADDGRAEEVQQLLREQHQARVCTDLTLSDDDSGSGDNNGDCGAVPRPPSRQQHKQRTVLIGTGVFVTDQQDEQQQQQQPGDEEHGLPRTQGRRPASFEDQQRLRERLRADVLARHSQEQQQQQLGGERQVGGAENATTVGPSSSHAQAASARGEQQGQAQSSAGGSAARTQLQSSSLSTAASSLSAPSSSSSSSSSAAGTEHSPLEERRSAAHTDDDAEDGTDALFEDE